MATRASRVARTAMHDANVVLPVPPFVLRMPMKCMPLAFTYLDISVVHLRMHVADHRLPAVVDMHVLNPHVLRLPAFQPSELLGLHSRGLDELGCRRGQRGLLSSS